MKGLQVTYVKFEDFAEQWFKEYAEIKHKPKSIEGYRWMSKRIYKSIGHIRIDKITARHLQSFNMEMSTEKQRLKVGDKWQETDRIFTKWNGLTLDQTAP